MKVGIEQPTTSPLPANRIFSPCTTKSPSVIVTNYNSPSPSTAAANKSLAWFLNSLIHLPLTSSAEIQPELASSMQERYVWFRNSLRHFPSLISTSSCGAVFCNGRCMTSTPDNYYHDTAACARNTSDEGTSPTQQSIDNMIIGCNRLQSSQNGEHANELGKESSHIAETASLAAGDTIETIRALATVPENARNLSPRNNSMSSDVQLLNLNAVSVIVQNTHVQPDVKKDPPVAEPLCPRKSCSSNEGCAILARRSAPYRKSKHLLPMFKSKRALYSTRMKRPFN